MRKTILRLAFLAVTLVGITSPMWAWDPLESIIRVCENGTLIIDGGTLQNAKLELIPGSSLIIRNNGVINMATGKSFEAPKGALVNIESGEIH